MKLLFNSHIPLTSKMRQLCASITLLIFIFSTLPVYAAADCSASSGPAEISGTSPAAENNCKKILGYILGQPAEPTIYLGMWSHHVINDSEEYRTDHHLVGASYKGYFLGTFVNSLDNRSWSAGFQRDVYRHSSGDVSLRLGYRAGLMYGYNELSLFDSKIFPMIQFYSDLSYKKIGIQLSWAGSALLAGFFFRF